MTSAVETGSCVCGGSDGEVNTNNDGTSSSLLALPCLFSVLFDFKSATDEDHALVFDVVVDADADVDVDVNVDVDVDVEVDAV